VKKGYWAYLIGFFALLLAIQGCRPSGKKAAEKQMLESALPTTKVVEKQMTESTTPANPTETVPVCTAQNVQPPSPAVTEVSPEQLRAMIANKENMIVLDVRDPQEFKSGPAPLEKIVNIPLPELQTRYTELPRDKKIVVVCRSGHRSAIAADFLLKAGYTNIYSLTGGMTAYRQMEGK
jgi:rhodanese-related sulfurtransferase